MHIPKGVTGIRHKKIRNHSAKAMVRVGMDMSRYHNQVYVIVNIIGGKGICHVVTGYMRL